MNDIPPLRIGVLGAARITPRAVIDPARRRPDLVRIDAIAARDPERARQFARCHGIPRVLPTYADLVQDPDIDAVYVPLPISLHGVWTQRALAAGKHVLCEKPLALNAGEAVQLAEAAAASGRVLMEAFHYRYHPLADRLQAILNRGEIGAVRHYDVAFCIPLLPRDDIRFHYELGGGALMDVGCYPVNLVRFLAGIEPRVRSASARLAGPQVDRYMRADLEFADGRTARIVCATRSWRLLDARLRVDGDTGTVRVWNPFQPHRLHLMTVRNAAGRRIERVQGDTTFMHQLIAFVDAVREGKPFPTDARDAIANHRLIDAIYERAGLTRRGAPCVAPAT